MRNEDIIRAWKDEAYRQTLNDVPAHPAGMVELDDEDLEVVAGGDLSIAIGISVSVYVATEAFSCWPWGCDDGLLQ